MQQVGNVQEVMQKATWNNTNRKPVKAHEDRKSTREPSLAHRLHLEAICDSLALSPLKSYWYTDFNQSINLTPCLQEQRINFVLLGDKKLLDQTFIVAAP